VRVANGGWTEWTAEKQAELLREVVAAGGNVTEAARITNLARQTIYNHKKSDPDFAKQLDAAILAGVDVLEDEARRRAHVGWLEPVFYKGEECGSVRKYSDTLLIFMLKAARPDVYRERASWEVSGPGGAPLATPGVVIHLPDNGRGTPNTE
jgi:hypothetical protein